MMQINHCTYQEDEFVAEAGGWSTALYAWNTTGATLLIVKKKWE